MFDCSIDLKGFSENFEQVFLREPCLIKMNNVFLDKFHREVLIPTTVVEKDGQQFFIQILSNDSKCTVRIFPGTDPKKTSGVKMALGLVANKIQATNDTKISQTNIEKYLLN